MISIDSDILRSLSSIAADAVSEISSGVERLNKVVIHDDWNCAERDVINNRLIEARKAVSLLSEKTQRYLDLIRQSADKFDTADSNTTKAFEKVYDSLSDLISIKSPVTHIATNTVSMAVKDTAYKGNNISDLFLGYNVNNIGTPLRVCNYSDVELA